MDNHDVARRSSERSNRSESGKVAVAARNALPTADDEAFGLDGAEGAGRRRAIEDNPMLQDEEKLRSALPR